MKHLSFCMAMSLLNNRSMRPTPLAAGGERGARLELQKVSENDAKQHFFQ